MAYIIKPMEPQPAMTFVDWLTAFGIPSIIICLIFIGGKLHLLSQLNSTMEKVKCNIKVIADALIVGKFEGFDHGLLQAYSPIKITERGDKLLNEIGFKKVFEEHSQDFVKCIDNENPKTDYDIEKSAIKSVFYLFDKPYFNSMKDYLYQHPDNPKDGIIMLAGIHVRDKYMELRK